MKKYNVEWHMTFDKTGTTEILADNEIQARNTVLNALPYCKGKTVFYPEKNKILSVTRSKTPKKKKYNHAFTLGFSVDSDNEGDIITAEELLSSLQARIALLNSKTAHKNEIVEVCGLPFDTYEN